MMISRKLLAWLSGGVAAFVLVAGAVVMFDQGAPVDVAPAAPRVSAPSKPSPPSLNARLPRTAAKAPQAPVAPPPAQADPPTVDPPPPDAETNTSSLAPLERPALPEPPPAPAIKEDATALRPGTDAILEGRFMEARAIRDGFAEGSIDRKIMTWAILHGAGAKLSVDEVAQAARELQGWSGDKTLRAARERALVREKPAPQAAVAAFSASPPETRGGVVLLARSHLALGEAGAAHALIGSLWHSEKLDAPEESTLRREFSALLTPQDHRRRMERMLYLDRAKAADRVAKPAGASELAKAWSAVLRSDRGAQRLLDAVPAAQRSAGYFFAQARLLRRQGKFVAAAKAMHKAPRDASAMIDPDAWWTERRVLSRELLDIGEAALAYQVASEHFGGSPSTIADAEFHAGWYALRHLGRAEAAPAHFARIVEVAEGPITRAKGYYWLGRAAEASGSAQAQSLFEKAAQWDTAFYGQLAAQKLGRRSIVFAQPVEARTNAPAGDAIRAVARLEAAGAPRLADALTRTLAEHLTDPAEIGRLAAMTESRGKHFLSLRSVKAAAARGVAVGVLSHPVGAIPASARIPDAQKALAYAVARQESEFNVSAVSGAGALGLLQLMPATARMMAKEARLPFSKARLTTDAGYNATLGSTFLGQQLDRFDGSYVLTFAGYNAGPGRARDWMKRYGDPRGKPVEDVVDWVERIPFTETRGYVQRVIENYQVYKMRLTGAFDIEGDLTTGR